MTEKVVGCHKEYALLNRASHLRVSYAGAAIRLPVSERASVGITIQHCLTLHRQTQEEQ